jgi:hypothetical protein
MGSDNIHVVEPPSYILFALWLLALAGLIVPPLAAHYWPDFGWVGQAERSLRTSLSQEEWEHPWQPIDQTTFSSGWIRCYSLEDALKLDKKVDDGHLHTGTLVISEGGLTWRGQ